jgi:hypothetical protein
MPSLLTQDHHPWLEWVGNLMILSLFLLAMIVEKYFGGRDE